MATYDRKQTLDYSMGDPNTDVYLRVPSVTNDVFSLYEWPIYGSSRLGVLGLKDGNGELYNNGPTTWTDPLPHTRAGYREYEITNHLGNVLATISDVKHGIDDPVDGTIDYYNPVPLSQQDYYPFGMLMLGRNDVKYEYRFGFNGIEKDDEVKGKGNHLDFKFRGYDPRIGKFFSVDPLFKDYPWNSSYAFAENDVIQYIDLEGKEKGGQPGIESKWGYKIPIDNTISRIFAEDYIYRYSRRPEPSILMQYKPRYMESFRKILDDKERDGGLVKTIKFIGKLYYNTANDFTIYGSRLIGLEPRDLQGHGVDQSDLQDAGINTLLNFIPIEAIMKKVVPNAKKVYNYSTYVGTQLGKTEKAALSTNTRKEFVTRHNKTAQDIMQLEKESNKTINYVMKTVDMFEEKNNK